MQGVCWTSSSELWTLCQLASLWSSFDLFVACTLRGLLQNQEISCLKHIANPMFKTTLTENCVELKIQHSQLRIANTWIRRTENAHKTSQLICFTGPTKHTDFFNCQDRMGATTFRAHTTLLFTSFTYMSCKALPPTIVLIISTWGPELRCLQAIIALEIILHSSGYYLCQSSYSRYDPSSQNRPFHPLWC